MIDHLLAYRPPQPLIQAFSGKVPFHDVPAPAVPASIMCGKRPPRPSHAKLTDALWELAERCWTATARDRPEMEEVVKALKEMLVSFLVYVKNLGLTHFIEIPAKLLK